MSARQRDRPARPRAAAAPAKAHAARQRERILDAAEKCFIESGFHAAGMAVIASTAGMSPGLIYRYFDSKNAIVQAIIARHLETEGTVTIDQLNSPKDMCDEMLELFENWRRGDDPKCNAALMLDLTSESTRDPEIARAVRSKDQVIGAGLTQALRRIAQAGGVKLSAAVARQRAVMLLCLVEGLASRAARDPELRGSELKPVLERMIAALLS
jgi:AcrR family transcriptional regulator